MYRRAECIVKGVSCHTEQLPLPRAYRNDVTRRRSSEREHHSVTGNCRGLGGGGVVWTSSLSHYEASAERNVAPERRLVPPRIYSMMKGASTRISGKTRDHFRPC